MKLRFSTSLFCFIVICTENSTAVAQDWSFLYGGRMPVAPYYLNANIGFTYTASVKTRGYGRSHLNRTTDGGMTWQYIDFFDLENCVIHQIYFISLSHGYAAGTTGLYETTDMGTTWKKISQISSSFSSVYAIGDKVFGFVNDPEFSTNWGPLYRSEDDGKTWDEILPRQIAKSVIDNQILPHVTGNKDSIVLAETPIQ